MFRASASAVTGSVSTVVLDFDELQCDETIGNYYAGGSASLGSGPGPSYGISFSPNAKAFSTGCADGSDTTAIPSFPSAMFFTGTAPGYLNVPAGFTGGLSFYYAAAVAPGVVNIWSGADGTGSLLATLPLPMTTACPQTPVYCVWTPIAMSFSGTAQSVDFEGSGNFIGYDDIALGISFITSPGKAVGNPSDQPGACPCTGPISLGSGNLFVQATDYRSAGPNTLAFTRYYNSLASTGTFANTLGVNWRSNFDRYLRIVSDTYVTLERPDGRQVNFIKNGSAWSPDTDVDLQLTNVSSTFFVSTWTVTDSQDNVETLTTPFGLKYAALTSLQTRNGYKQTMAYDSSNRLISVTDSYNRKLLLTYQSGVLKTLVTPDSTLTYGYDSSGLVIGTLDRLRSVTYSTTPSSSTSYVYENSNFVFDLTGIVDEDGNRYTTWTYDVYGRAVTAQLGAGVDKVTVVYNDSDGSRMLTNASTESETYMFTPLQGVAKLTEIDRPRSSVSPLFARKFTYDSNGFLASQADWNGNVTAYVNDAHGQPVSITQAQGTAQARTTTIAYHSVFHLPVTVVEPGLTTTFTYDAAGNLLTRTAKDTTSSSVPYSTSGTSRTWTFTWSNFLPASAQSPRTDVSQITRFTFDSTGALTQIANALNQTTKFTNTPGGYPKTIIDPNGVSSQLVYDGRQRLISRTVTTSLGALTTTWNYDPAGNLLSVILPDGSGLTNSYDAAHRLTAIADPFHNRLAYQLDPLGNRTLASVFDPNGAPLLQHSDSYDSLGRLIQDVGSAGQTSSYTYDSNNNLLSVTDPLSHITQQTFDALNRVVKITDTDKGVTQISYDAHDRTASVTDPLSAVTSYVYDGFGDLIQSSVPAAGATVYRYDAAGNVVQKVDARGVTANFTYDALNRRTSAAYPGGSSESVTFTYDQSGHGVGIGRLTSVTDAAGTLSRSYDERGNISAESRVHSGVTLATTYGWDKAGRIASIAYPSGLTVAYSRDVLGRLAGVTAKPPGASAPAAVLSSIAYQPFGRVKSQMYGNGFVETRTFDEDYHLLNLAASGFGKLMNLTYAYDANNNVISLADAVASANSQTFGYDEFDRLVAATGSYGSLTYSYDAVGNRLTGPDAGADGLTAFTSLTYNQGGRLASTAAGSQQLTQYTYDAFGQRIVKTGSVTSTTLYQYSPAGELIEEAGGQGSMIADYIYADGRPVGEVAIGGNLYFIHDDQLGAPQVATNLTQGTVWAGTYQPFGSLTPSSQIAILAQDLRLPGQEPDVETGLYHNGFREYVPLLGRYTQSDPLGIASGLNTYAYVNDNPVSNTDRFGLSLSQSLAAVTGRVVNLSQESAARAPGIFTRKNRLEQSTAAEILPAPPAVPDLFDQFFPAPNLAKAP